MALFSSGGSVFDDYVSIQSGGLLNPGQGKDAKRAARKENEAMRSDLMQRRKSGIKEGNAEFEKTYGMKKKDLAGDFKKIIAARRNAVNLSSSDPVVNQIRQSANDASKQLNANLAQAGVKGGAGARALQGVDRAAKKDADMAQRSYYEKALGEYQDITGNLATNAQRLPLLYAQSAMAGQYHPPAAQAPGLFNNVLGSIGLA
jgi:hypothetical protein